MRKLICVLFLTFPFVLIGQKKTILNSGYMGYSNYRPNFKKGMERVGNWQGLEFSLGNVIFSMHSGSLREVDADSTFGSPDGKIFNVGYRMGLDLQLGRDSFFSTGVKPFIQFTFPVAQITNKITDTRTSSIGVGLSPGVQFKFSHAYLIVRYDASLLLNTTFFGGNGKYNAAKGYLGGTIITLGFDNAFDLLNPRVFSIKGLKVETKKRTTLTDYGYNKNGYWFEEYTTVTTTTKTPGEIISSLIDAFWGVGPSYSFSSLSKRQAPSSMKGVNVGARIGYFMFDGFYQEGKMGLEDKVGKNEILINFPQLRNYDFSSQIKGKQYGGRIGFNLSKMIKFGNFESSALQTKDMKTMVPFARFSSFFTMGVSEFTGNPIYTFKEASNKLATYQSKNAITPTANTNPEYLLKNTTFTGWGISLEFGAAFINSTWYKYKNASIANHQEITIGANIPIGRISRNVRTSFIVNKYKRNQKKKVAAE